MALPLAAATLSSSSWRRLRNVVIPSRRASRQTTGLKMRFTELMVAILAFAVSLGDEGEMVILETLDTSTPWVEGLIRMSSTLG